MQKVPLIDDSFSGGCGARRLDVDMVSHMFFDANTLL